MCGPSAQQTASQDQLAQLQAQSLQEAQTTYGEDQAILGQLTPIYSAIAAKGPDQKGYSDEEFENLNAQAVEGTAENYGSAAKAVNEQLAGEGGGTNPLPSGAQTELKQQVANSAAQSESQQESGILSSDYAQGYKQFEDATNGLLSVSGQYNPTAYTGAATGAGTAASNEANTIAAQQNSWLAPVLGAVGSIGGGFAGDFSFGKSATPAPCWIAAELWGGWNESRTVMVRHWLLRKWHRGSLRWRIILCVYIRHGEATANAIHRWPILRRIFLPVFNAALSRAKAETGD